MLVNMKEMLQRASAGNYAVAAPNVNTELDARAAIEAAEELNAPIILDVVFTANPDIVTFGRILTDLANQSRVPVAVNLDHGGKFEHAILAIKGGFSSIMADRSTLPYEENVAQVKELARIAHAAGCTIEAELGHVGQGDNYEADRNAGLTQPDEAVKYIEDTGIDCLAVAIGTAHGAYTSKPYLDFDRLAEIKKATNNFPLVLHGSSGTGDENLRKVCQMGINKVNVSNDLMRRACDTVCSADLTGNGAYTLWDVAKKGYKSRLMELIEVFGSVGKAYVPECKGIGSGSIIMSEK